MEANGKDAGLVVKSSKSLRTSLLWINQGKSGLDNKRSNLLNRVPKPNDWAKFDYESIKVKDLAYLTAASGDEFALLRGKRIDILFHGEMLQCCFTDELVELLLKGSLNLIAHSHPGEDIPIPSTKDRQTLTLIHQHSSIIISATTGIETVFTDNEFDV